VVELEVLVSHMNQRGGLGLVVVQMGYFVNVPSFVVMCLTLMLMMMMMVVG
jgi:hypothetical protein